jgi:hypothetical protein
MEEEYKDIKSIQRKELGNSYLRNNFKQAKKKSSFSFEITESKEYADQQPQI